jgi:phosphohistidine swiveling domain-containing protein
MSYLRQFSELGSDDVDLAGGKGANLGELTRAGLPVPSGFVLTTDAYRAFVQAAAIGASVEDLAAAGNVESRLGSSAEQIRALFSGPSIPADLRDEISAGYAQLGEEVPVAVRSSATAEDLADASFAGQQETYLNVRGLDRVLEAVRQCWASLWTERAMAYRQQHGIDPTTVSLAVVIQRMVEADASGVAFTANPVTGARDEVVIAAAWGLGESVVSGSVDTDDLVVRKPAGPVVSRQVRQKTVMTTYAERGTEEVPVELSRRNEPVLDDAAAIELTGLAVRIEEHYSAPQDIEWARAADQFFIVQSRPITALPQVDGPLPTEWTVPHPKNMYVRASIIEQLPDPLSPLFADLIDGAVTRSMTNLLTEFLGRNVLREGDLGVPTINGYAYYSYGRGGMARILWRTPKAMKILVRRDEYSARPRWQNYSLPRYQGIVRRWTARSTTDLTSAELLDGVVELLNAGAEYYTSVQTIIPLAASSEVIFTWFYNIFVRRAGDPAAQTFLLGFDSEPIRAEKSLYDLAADAKTEPALAAALTGLSSAERADLVRGSEPPTGVASTAWEQWRTGFMAHLDRYGHAVYNLDFMNAVPADEPGPLLDTIRFYLSGQGANPYERQQRTTARREEQTATVLARLDRARGATFSRLLRWAQEIAPVREDALADVGLAWPQMRRMLGELGRRLVATGALERAEDVYWLRYEELRTQSVAIDAGRSVERIEVSERKRLWRGQRRATPPQLLPKGAWFYGMEKVMPAASEEQSGDVIKGIGASAGQVTAAARVLTGPQEFGQMVPGEVLVASITTPAWTSLFTMASGVVTDIGGPLSHSSIVAREYGIPAVLGTAVATRRIGSGERIRVDGDAGTVTLLDQQATGAATGAATGRVSRPSKRVVLAFAAAVGLGAAAWAALRRRQQ